MGSTEEILGIVRIDDNDCLFTMIAIVYGRGYSDLFSTICSVVIGYDYLLKGL